MCGALFLCAAGSPAEAITDPDGGVCEVPKIGPGPAHDLPASRADGVLAQLLLEDRIARILAGPQQAAVLDLSVELADRAMLGPAEVRVRNAARKADGELQNGAGKAGTSDGDPAARLPHAFGSPVRKGQYVTCGRRARPPLRASHRGVEPGVQGRESAAARPASRRPVVLSELSEVAVVPYSM